MKIVLRVSYVDEDGKEFGLEELVEDPLIVKSTIDFILTALEVDYRVRHPGENVRWA